MQPAGESYQENVGGSENVDNSVDTEQTEPQATSAPLQIAMQSHMGLFIDTSDSNFLSRLLLLVLGSFIKFFSIGERSMKFHSELIFLY